MDIFTVWVVALSEVGIFVLGYILGFPAGRKSVFREAKSNQKNGDLK
jgi:hypothetical protein